MISIIGWVLYGLLVGYLAKILHPGEDAVGFLPTLAIGIVGSYIGGLLNWALAVGTGPFSPSGIVMGTIGGVIFCWAYRKYRLNRFFQMHNRMPLWKSPK